MAHETANGVTVANATEYHAPAKGGSMRRLDAILRRSERLVCDLAPPDGETASREYTETAADAELAVFEHLWERPSYADKDDVMQASTTFADRKALEDLVRDSMGRFYVGPRVVPPNTPETRARSVLTNVSEAPLW